MIAQLSADGASKAHTSSSGGRHLGKLGVDFRVYGEIWGFPKIRGTLLGVPIIRTIVFWGLYWGPLILGNYHLSKVIHLEGCFKVEG